MTEEEKKAIGQLIWYKQLFNNGYCKDCNELCSSGASIPSIDLANSIATVLNLIQRQDRRIQKLKNKNKDLLRKLRNRVKEVNKLIKYSTYKKEFSRLNIILEQKDRQIDLMADTILKDTLKLDTYWCNGCSKTIECPYKNPKDCIKQYFVEQAKEV